MKFLRNKDSDKYSDARNNPVNAKGQLKENEYVNFESLEGKGKRILFLGNSITLHGVLESIGWKVRWGMAASAKEKDYVHRVVAGLSEKYEDMAVCICQVANWEIYYTEGEKHLHLYESAADFDADIVVCNFIGNCKVDGFDTEVFERQYKLLADKMIKNASTVIYVSNFWAHPGNAIIEKIASERGCKYVSIEDLGTRDDMKAYDTYGDLPPASHPGDKGMEEIANRLLDAILN